VDEDLEGEVSDLKKFLDDEPSWDQIRADARRLLRSTRVAGGEQGAYDSAMDNLIKPQRGAFTDEQKLLADTLESDQKAMGQEKDVQE
jgi:hypothetical protein